MTLILLIFSLLVSGILATLFHLLWGRRLLELLAFWFIGWLGFLLGQLLGMAYELPLPTIGVIQIVPATIGTLGGIAVVNVLKV